MLSFRTIKYIFLYCHVKSVISRINCCVPSPSQSPHQFAALFSFWFLLILYHSWMDQNLGMKHRGVNTELQDLNKALGKHSIVEEGKTFSMFHTSWSPFHSQNIMWLCFLLPLLSPWFVGPQWWDQVSGLTLPTKYFNWQNIFTQETLFDLKSYANVVLLMISCLFLFLCHTIWI